MLCVIIPRTGVLNGETNTCIDYFRTYNYMTRYVCLHIRKSSCMSVFEPGDLNMPKKNHCTNDREKIKLLKKTLLAPCSQPHPA